MAIQKNFNVVGSPVITDEGIASGFANGSYLTSTIDFETAVTIHTKIKTPTNWDSRYSCVHEFTTELGNMSVENSNRNFICYSYSQNKDVVVFKPSLNTIYYIKYTIDLSANEKRVSYSLNNVDWSPEVVIADTSMNKGTNPIFLIGINQGFNSPWLGTIDLKETYAEVDGSIIWNAWKEVGIIPGSITVDKGYYNADGTNIIKFTSPITKTLTEAAYQTEWANNVFLTLDNNDTSSFVLHNNWSPLTGYKVNKKIDSPTIYLDPSLKYILGTEPTSIDYTITPYNSVTNGYVSLTKGWIYQTQQNRTYQNKDTNPVSVEQLKTNAGSSSTIGYKNRLGLIFNQTSDISLPAIASTFDLVYYYNMNQDIYIDNTKTKLLGTTAMSNSWVVEPNYTVVGSPTVSDNGDATGFSDSNFLTIPNPFTSTMNRFTLITSFTTTNNTVSNSGIFDSPDGKTNIRLTITDTSKLHFRISTTGVQTYPVDITGTTTIENNKKYWAKVEYDNSANYSIYLSEDGHVWNQEAFAIITDRPYHTSGIQNVIGDNIADGSYFEGTLHLADWSITVDGIKVWEYLKKPYSINTGTSATDTGSITYTVGYKYIDETNGSFFIQTNTTKTLDELVDPSDRTEHMKLVLGIKQDGTTDFFLAGGLLPPDYTYTEDIADVYLDRTLSYIYGTTADPRVKFTINATPNTATVNMVDLVPSPPVQVSGIGTATILVDPSNNLINYGVSAEGYTKKSGTVTATADDTLDVVLEAEAPAERTELTLPTDTFYAWFQPTNNLKYSLTETPGSNDWMYDSRVTDMPSINVRRESSGESGVTFGDRGAIVDGDTFSIGSYSTYTRDTKYDGEFYFCKAWMSDDWESYVTKKEIPESGDVVYSHDILNTGAITNAGTVGTEWTYDSSSGELTNSNTTIHKTTDYIWVKASALEGDHK